MATNISGSVTLTYGAHTHNESFNTTASTLTYSHKSHEYSAGAAVALVAGAALDVGTIDGAEGLLLIKNNQIATEQHSTIYICNIYITQILSLIVPF